MQQGKAYLVKELDISSKIAVCQEADLKYYTKTRDYTDIHVIGGNIVRPLFHYFLFSFFQHFLKLQYFSSCR